MRLPQKCHSEHRLKSLRTSFIKVIENLLFLVVTEILPSSEHKFDKVNDKTPVIWLLRQTFKQKLCVIFQEFINHFDKKCNAKFLLKFPLYVSGQSNAILSLMKPYAYP